MADKHPSVGEVRGVGLFWAIELVRDRETREPLVPFNASGADAAPMNAVIAACKKAACTRSRTSTACSSPRR
jgi:taurine--2-oxoglutarate transaminase